MKFFFITIIRLYRRYLSPMLPATCRFVPTCSEYALEAFEKKGVLTAAWLTCMRILKCHPFHPGGYDPVNPVREQSSPTIAGGGCLPPSSGNAVHPAKDPDSLTG